MFKKIFVEKAVLTHPRTLRILDFFKQSPYPIKQIDEVFGKVRKPYLDKREDLNLFIGEKKGALVKLAPPAYGLSNHLPKRQDYKKNIKTTSMVEEHYYFIHAYNCIYECEYCYLQGYFSSPDLVLFINHEDIINEINKIIIKNPNKKLTFHSGEFSDGLALSHISGEIPLYWEFFSQHPKANLEIRSKSNNLKILKNLKPTKNIILSFSLSPHDTARKIEIKTPALKSRLKAISYLTNQGYTIALHLDPIIYSNDFIKKYEDLIQSMLKAINSFELLAYISLGVVRFTKDVFKEVQYNYPNSEIFREELQISFDNKYRYIRPQRKWLINWVYKELVKAKFPANKIYFCMED